MPVGGPQKRDDGSRWYWRLRMALEVIKAVVWVFFQWWLWSANPFGPFV